MKLFKSIQPFLLAALAGWLLVACDRPSTDAPVSETKPDESVAAKAQQPGDPMLCAAHGAPKTHCFICDSSLREKGRLWCNEHGRYEDRCWLCHPELEDKDRLYCKEHFLYEDECFLCHPELLEESPAPAGAEGDQAGAKRDPNRLWCGEHGVYEDECLICHPELAQTDGPSIKGALMCQEHGVLESECAICHPELASQLALGEGLKIRFLSPGAAEKIGVRTMKPEPAEVSGALECFAELSYNKNRLAEITPLVGGVVKSVAVDLGERVDAGDLLATVASMPIAEAQGRFLAALAQERLARETFKRERNLFSKDISSQRDLQEAEAKAGAAEAEAEAARQRLSTLGFSESQIEQLTEKRKATGDLELRAPFAGEIVERFAVQGAMAETGRPLFQLADLSTMWAMLTVSESDLSRIQAGREVRLQVASYPKETFQGRVTWISSEVDHRTRMAKARAEIANPQRRLRAHMFATAHVLEAESSQALVLPEASIQWFENRPFAFVRESDDLYLAKPLILGPRENGCQAVLDGLNANDLVVTEGSFAVKSQFLISRLGAGCVHD